MRSADTRCSAKDENVTSFVLLNFTAEIDDTIAFFDQVNWLLNNKRMLSKIKVNDSDQLLAGDYTGR